MSGLELKPCPFCGGGAVHITPHNGGNPYVMCIEKHCTQPHPDAIAAWNRRSPDPAQIRANALREALAIAEYMANRNCMAADVARDLKRLIDAPLSPPAVDNSPAPDAGGKEGV